jgi:hypothetical protein
MRGKMKSSVLHSSNPEEWLFTTLHLELEAETYNHVKFESQTTGSVNYMDFNIGYELLQFYTIINSRKRFS